MSSSSTEKHLRAVARGHTTWAHTIDRPARTAAARRAFEDRFERQARELHPDTHLTPAEVHRIAQHLRSAYFAELAAKSVAARRRRRDGVA